MSLQSLRGFAVSFSCAHFYRHLKWSDEKNQSTFGRCFSLGNHGHGHDYKLWIEAAGPWCNSEKFKILKAAGLRLQEYLDHRHLNYEVPFFQNKTSAEASLRIPTTENLVLFCRDFLQQELCCDLSQISLTLHENAWLGSAISSCKPPQHQDP